MNGWRRRGGAAAVLLLTALAVATAARAESRPPYGGTLALARAAGADGDGAFDPAEARDPWQLAAAHALHAGLFRHDARRAVQPHLLDGPPEVLADGALRCRLRRPLAYHDGRAVEAADVRWSVQRLARGTGPLTWLPELVAVHVVDRRTFDLVAPALRPAELVAVLALPQAAVLPRGGDGRVGLGPFRLPARPAEGAGALVLAAWEEAPGGRPFLDGLRLVAVAPGPAEAEAFHYGQLDLSFTDAPRLRDRPRLDGPLAETLVAAFSPAWGGAASQAERAGLAALLAPDRAELVRHCDLPAEPARRWRPDGGPTAVPAQGRADDWSGEPMTVAWRSEDPALGDVAAALRDLLARHGMVQAVAAPARELPPRCRGRACLRHDLHLATVPWPGVDGIGALGWAAAWLGLEGALPAGGVRRAARDPAGAWRRFAGSGLAVPLLHVRRVVRHAPGLVGLRFAPWGGLVFEDVWVRPGRLAGGRP